MVSSFRRRRNRKPLWDLNPEGKAKRGSLKVVLKMLMIKDGSIEGKKLINDIIKRPPTMITPFREHRRRSHRKRGGHDLMRHYVSMGGLSARAAKAIISEPMVVHVKW